jgi:hypothetical protein
MHLTGILPPEADHPGLNNQWNDPDEARPE